MNQNKKIPNRAETYEEKKQVMEKLLGLWAKYPTLRFGQLITAALHDQHSTVNVDFFNMEDFILVEKVVEFDKGQAVDRAIKESGKKE